MENLQQSSCQAMLQLCRFPCSLLGLHNKLPSASGYLPNGRAQAGTFAAGLSARVRLTGHPRMLCNPKSEVVVANPHQAVSLLL